VHCVVSRDVGDPLADVLTRRARAPHGVVARHLTT
jgi:hypothetical protein